MKSFIRRILEYVKAHLNAGTTVLQMMSQKAVRVVFRGYALLWHRFYLMRYRISVWGMRHGPTGILVVIILLMCATAYFYSAFQTVLEPFLSVENRLADLRSLFLALGGALIGAVAISFSLVMFAMQVNVERMPHGLFWKFSKDKRIMGAFGGTFVLAILIACASLITNKSWVAIVTLVSLWGIFLIFILFLYAYRRALVLINPIKQLNLLVKDACHGMRAWSRWAKRVAPLFEGTDSGHDVGGGTGRSTHDLSRIAYFQANPHWTAGAQQGIQHAISYARRYAEQVDHEVSSAALSAVVKINQGYVEAKGKTFFANYLLVDNPLSSDAFINGTLEHLRQNIRVGISRGDEQQIEQTLQTLAALAQVYINIDYSNPYASKTHALLAAGYLSEAVKTVAPHNMADVLMEGVRLMGQSAHLILLHGDPTDIAPLTDEIGLIACTGIANENYRPVTLIAIEQLAKLTFWLVRTDRHDIKFMTSKLKENVTMVAKLFLTSVPDVPLGSVHRTYLAPYYSITTSDSLLSWFMDLINAIGKTEPDDKAALTVIRNIEVWADGLYQHQKELLILAIEKRSHFTFDMIYWIKQVTELLLALSNAPACGTHYRDNLRKHALWLICTLSWVPDDKETIAFVENYQMTEILFEAAINAHKRNCFEFSAEARGLLLDWAFKGGKHKTGQAILERSLYGIATLSLVTGNAVVVEDLKRKISACLTQPGAPDQQIRDQAAREIRRRAASLYRRGHLSSRIEHEMSQVDHATMKSLLEELANLLSPDTSAGPVNIDFLW
jgi:hypothetical protein